MSYDTPAQTVIALLTKIWKTSYPKLALFFQCGYNYTRFIDEGSSFYQTRSLWLLTNGKLPDTQHDLVITNQNPRKTVKIAICSADELSQATKTDSRSISFSATNLDSDCKVFLFVNNGPHPKDEAIQVFRNAVASYLKNSKCFTLFKIYIVLENRPKSLKGKYFFSQCTPFDVIIPSNFLISMRKKARHRIPPFKGFGIFKF